MSGPLQNGHFYTVGRCKSTGDRSYLGHVWEVLETTETHAVIRSIAQSSFGFGKQPIVVLISEFDWTDGAKIAAALADYAVTGGAS